jgi:hypothetical protein
MVTNVTALGIVSKICDLVYKAVNQIVVLSPGFKNLLVDRGVPSKKIEIIYNWADEQGVRKISEEPQADMENIGGFIILDAALLLKDEWPKLQFVVLGQGLELRHLKDEAKKLNLENVKFISAVSKDKVGDYLNAADALLVHLKADPLFQITIPGKTQDYMAIGKPMIMGVPGDASSLVSMANCGVCIEPQNANSLAEAVKKLMLLSRPDLKALGTNGSSFYDDNLSLKVGAKLWIEVFAKIIQSKNN